MSVVRVEHLTKAYDVGGERVLALRDVTLSIERGVFLAVAGPSGSGKSTLLNLIGCIDVPTSGKVYIDEEDVTGKSPDDLAGLRARTIGFIFQAFNLFPVLSAAENVEYPLLGFPELARDERQARVAQYLDMVGLAAYSKHRPNELSGGQRQRVAIARALATGPKVVLADEPTANLDHRTAAGILDLMREINRTLGTTFVFSTHDKKIMAMADRLVRIEDGRVRALGMQSASGWVVIDPRGTRRHRTRRARSA